MEFLDYLQAWFCPLFLATREKLIWKQFPNSFWSATFRVCNVFCRHFNWMGEERLRGKRQDLFNFISALLYLSSREREAYMNQFENDWKCLKYLPLEQYKISRFKLHSSIFPFVSLCRAIKSEMKVIEGFVILSTSARVRQVNQQIDSRNPLNICFICIRKLFTVFCFESEIFAYR